MYINILQYTEVVAYFACYSRCQCLLSVSVGFGHALAIHLDRLGATVFAGCLAAEGSGAMKLKKDGSDRMHVVQLDVTNDEQVAKCVQYVSTVTNGSGEYLKVLCCLLLFTICIASIFVNY